MDKNQVVEFAERYIQESAIALGGGTVDASRAQIEKLKVFIDTDSQTAWEILVFVIERSYKKSDPLFYYIVAGEFEDFVNLYFEKYLDKFMEKIRSSIIWKEAFGAIYYGPNCEPGLVKLLKTL